MGYKGHFPVYKMGFRIGTKGLDSLEEDMVTIAGAESLGLTIDGSTETWTEMVTDGWSSSLMTGKSLSFDLKGKRKIGDAGNDYVADTAWKDGLDCSTKAEVTFPDGAKLTFDCVINVTAVGGGDSTNVAPLEFTLLCDGKPTYVPAV